MAIALATMAFLTTRAVSARRTRALSSVFARAVMTFVAVCAPSIFSPYELCQGLKLPELVLVLTPAFWLPVLIYFSQISTKKTFGTGYSGGTLDTDEITLFAHKINPPAGYVGVMTHFWTTCSAEAVASRRRVTLLLFFF